MSPLIVLLGILPILVSAFTPFDPNTWCGKPYMPGFDPVDPGGQTPSPVYSQTPLLDISFQPRHSLYLASESTASVILGVSLSHYYGKSFSSSSNTTSFDYVLTTNSSSNGTLAIGKVAINSTKNEISFDLSGLIPQTTPYTVQLTLSTLGGKGQTYVATTNLNYLPVPISGSITKIDNLHQGLLITTASNPTTWKPFFPYGWYGSAGTILNDTSNADAYLAAGFNFINLVPDASQPLEPFPQPSFDNFLTRMDEIGLYLVYDMRGNYMNNTLLTAEVERIKSHPSLLLWYTADEPDGWSYPLNSTQLAYNQIRTLDPYHPISLVLNCIDFYYAPFSSGADIILEDAYPIAINATYSTVWNTPCTPELGDCGCDGCNGTLLDVPDRIDILKSYQRYYSAPKPVWAVPQAFGNESYWPRYPTPAEEIAMQQLSLNHGAMGISSWLYPSVQDLNSISGSFGSIISKDPIASFLLTGNRTQSLSTTSTTSSSSSSPNNIDATAWTSSNSSNNTSPLLLFAIVNPSYDTISTSPITISLPTTIPPLGPSIQIIWSPLSSAAAAAAPPNSTTTAATTDSDNAWTIDTETSTISKTGGLKGLDVWVLLIS